MPSRARTTQRPLKDYRAKRDFKTTPEPSGSKKEKKASTANRNAPIFCVQKHLASHLHYDFRLEHRGVLLSWAVPKGPSLHPADKRLAMRVEDHPRDYADFEGVIPEGYGAGIVMLWDMGTWEPTNGDVDQALERGELKFTLQGVKLKGSWVLVRTRGGRKGASINESRSWLLIKHHDEWAGPVDVTTAAPDSVKSFGDFADILAADKPDIWESHRPAEGGEAGAMLREIIAEAAKRKAKKQSAPKKTGKTIKRPTTKRPSRAKA
jgi:bifunctional non-homologous end joining protein LigD